MINTLKAAFWVLIICCAWIAIPIVATIIGVLATFFGTIVGIIAAILIVKTMYDLEDEDNEFD